jgi:hypothetical protein
MKLQLTKDKTIDVKMPWEKSGGGVPGGRKAGLSDVVGVSLFDGDPRGCPAVRLVRRKGGVQLVAAGFVQSPAVSLPSSWEESKIQPVWELPAVYQAPQAALAVTSQGMFVRQTTIDALTAAPAAPAAAEKKKKLGVRRGGEEKKAEAAKPAAAAPQPFVPVSRDGSRFVTAPMGDEAFVLQTGLPEFQVLWLSRLLPEGRRPTACSLQTCPAALLNSIFRQPAFEADGGTAVAVLVTRTAVYFAGYRKGDLVLFRECPDVAGFDVMRELVKSGLGVGDDIVDSILEDTLIDPRPALEPLVRPVLQQLQLSIDYLAQRHDVHVDKMFLMGLPAGAMYWNQFAQETIGRPFVSPGVFEGIVPPKSAGVVPDMKPNETQAFLAALGAALAAMEVQG